MPYDQDDDNSDDYPLPPGFQGHGDEIERKEIEDIAIVMGRPVVPSAQEIELGKTIGIDFSDPYDDSEKHRCKRCLREVWVGPKQRELMVDLTGVIVMCPEHAVQSMIELEADMGNVINLDTKHPRGN